MVKKEKFKGIIAEGAASTRGSGNFETFEEEVGSRVDAMITKLGHQVSDPSVRLKRGDILHELYKTLGSEADDASALADEVIEFTCIRFLKKAKRH